MKLKRVTSIIDMWYPQGLHRPLDGNWTQSKHLIRLPVTGYALECSGLSLMLTRELELLPLDPVSGYKVEFFLPSNKTLWQAHVVGIPERFCPVYAYVGHTYKPTLSGFFDLAKEWVRNTLPHKDPQVFNLTPTKALQVAADTAADYHGVLIDCEPIDLTYRPKTEVYQVPITAKTFNRCYG